MKVSTFLFTSLLILTFCSERINDHYSGIVLDELGRPLEGVLVREDYFSEGYTENRCITDSNGYFKFNRTGLPEVILSKDGYLNDTINLIWHQHGETTEYSEIVKKDSSILVLRSKI